MMAQIHRRFAIYITAVSLQHFFASCLLCRILDTSRKCLTVQVARQDPQFPTLIHWTHLTRFHADSSMNNTGLFTLASGIRQPSLNLQVVHKPPQYQISARLHEHKLPKNRRSIFCCLSNAIFKLLDKICGKPVVDFSFYPPRKIIPGVLIDCEVCSYFDRPRLEISIQWRRIHKHCIHYIMDAPANTIQGTRLLHSANCHVTSCFISHQSKRNI